MQLKINFIDKILFNETILWGRCYLFSSDTCYRGSELLNDLAKVIQLVGGMIGKRSRGP